MATSPWQPISYCSQLIRELNPKKVLDVGLGSTARWGSLIREFTDVWNSRVYKNTWKVRLDGVEIYKPNILPIHKYLYTNIYLGDIRKIINNLVNYDLILLGDVIEHLSEEDAIVLLKQCLKKAKYVLVNTPLGELKNFPQDAIYGNPFEKHLHLFRASEFIWSREWVPVRMKLYSFGDTRSKNYGTFLLVRSDSRYHLVRRILTSLSIGSVRDGFGD